MKSIFRTRRRKIAAVVITLALIAIATATAAWLATSNKSAATGKTAALATLTLSPASAGAVASDPTCGPGGACDVSVTVDTAGVAGYTATHYTVQGDQSQVVSSNVASCPNTNFSVNPANLPWGTFKPLATPVPLLGTGPTTIVIPDAVLLAANAPTGCAGISFTLNQVVSGGGVAIQASIGS